MDIAARHIHSHIYLMATSCNFWMLPMPLKTPRSCPAPRWWQLETNYPLPTLKREEWCDGAQQAVTSSDTIYGGYVRHVKSTATKPELSWSFRDSRWRPRQVAHYNYFMTHMKYTTMNQSMNSSSITLSILLSFALHIYSFNIRHGRTGTNRIKALRRSCP